MESSNRMPWDRQDGEQGRWYDRFLVFLDLGVDRSVHQAYLVWCEQNPPKSGKGRPTSAGGQWYKVAKHWKWEDRAIAYDAHERQRQEQELRELKLERKKTMLNEEWELREELLNKARQMIATPIHTARTVDKDGRQVTVTPAKWSFRTVVDFLGMASQLGRFSLEMDKTMHPELEALALLANSGMVPAEQAEIVSAGLDAIVNNLQLYNAHMVKIDDVGGASGEAESVAIAEGDDEASDNS